MRAIVVVIVFAAVFFSCHSPKEEKMRPGVKYLSIKVDIPDNLIVMVSNFFESESTCWGCMSLSEQSWNWIPSLHRSTYYVTTNGASICLPLFVNKNTYCKWKFNHTQIMVCQANDNFELRGFHINPKADTTLVLKYANLVDTMQYTCYEHINQYMAPPDNQAFLKCDQIGRDEQDPIDYYIYDGIHGDTAHITIVAHYDSTAIRYMDTTLAGPNYFRIFGKDEKVPGLNEESDRQ